MGKSNLVPYSFAFTGDGDMFEMAVGRNMPRSTTGRLVAPVVAADEKTFRCLQEAKKKYIEATNNDLKDTIENYKQKKEKVLNPVAPIDARARSKDESPELAQTDEKRAADLDKIVRQEAAAVKFGREVISAAEATEIIKFEDFKKNFYLGGKHSNGGVKLEILGHGNIGYGGVASSTHDGKYASFKEISKGLASVPWNIIGRSPLLDRVKEFRLHSCFSAEGLKDKEAPAEQFRKALLDAGFSGAKVKGYFGAGLRFAGRFEDETGVYKYDTTHSYRKFEDDKRSPLRSNTQSKLFAGN